jgi:hypothetical protein
MAFLIYNNNFNELKIKFTDIFKVILIDYNLFFNYSYEKLLRVNAVKQFILFLLILSISGCGFEDYIQKDKDGETIDCLDLRINSASFNKTIRSLEIKHNYTFTQCKEEIEKEFKNNCIYLIDKSKNWNFNRNYSQADTDACADQVNDYLDKFDTIYEIKGNALTLDDAALNRSGMVATKIIKEKIFLDSEYYSFTIYQGEHSFLMQYKTEDKATKSRNEIIDFLSK